ncbi:ABC transporter permease subunit [Vibrio wakamikoensis]|uniref:ABC transporter permease subunit n=1 Tax=Vibrio wakamikoensis TaxID=2910251 RepID=UPI003D1C1B47
MATANFSLHTKDRKRLIKDRLVRWIVSFGGLSVLAGLIFIFVYLAYVTLPLFSDNEVTWQPAISSDIAETPVLTLVSDSGHDGLFFFADGGYIQQSLVTGEQTSHRLPDNIVRLQAVDEKILLAVDSKGRYAALKPKLQLDQSSGDAQLIVPDLDEEQWISLPNAKLVNAVVNKGETVIASIDERGMLQAGYSHHATESSSGEFSFATLPTTIEGAKELVVTPDGRTLYVRFGNQLVVINRNGHSLYAREVVDLSAPNGVNVSGVHLLSGAYSLLVQYDNQQVWQWFDVLIEGERKLTPIRSFQFDADIAFLTAEATSKGFNVLLASPQTSESASNSFKLQSLYTTSEKLVSESPVPSSDVRDFALSNNGHYALVLSEGAMYRAYLPNEHQEISLSALWQKVWYESYPEPEFIWQTTAASDDFEAKYSLVPIAFGTIKAALFAMLFSVPIAVFGAIYTAYFMSSKMRRVVKPTIELMEALPTVIIGFLAGLWFAPIVETHLPAILLLLLALPLLSLLSGAVWYTIPKAYTSKLPSGLHPFTLIPVILIAIYLAMTFSSDMEVMLFNGDARVFLATHGIDFDQRNALVVGFAMGFAVIPTIFTIAEDAIFSVPKHLSDGSLALGATQWQTLIYVVLLTASPGIFSAVMMGLGRAVGETMIVLMATGNTPILDWNIFEGMRTLSATMAVELPESEVGSSHYRLLFLIALILFSFTFVVNSLAEWVRQRLREKYSAL